MILSPSTWYCGHYWPIAPASDDRRWWLWSSRWNEGWQGKPKYWEKTCPSATLSTTNLTWPDLGSNPGGYGGKPATNRLSYGVTFFLYKFSRYSDELRGERFSLLRGVQTNYEVHTFPVQGAPGTTSRGKSSGSVKLTSHLHLMLRMTLYRNLYLHFPISLHFMVLN
jgi:hypothetical protein